MGGVKLGVLALTVGQKEMNLVTLSANDRTKSTYKIHHVFQIMNKGINEKYNQGEVIFLNWHSADLQFLVINKCRI